MRSGPRAGSRPRMSQGARCATAAARQASPATPSNPRASGQSPGSSNAARPAAAHRTRNSRPGQGPASSSDSCSPSNNARRHQAGTETLAQALQEPYAGVRRRGAAQQVQAAGAEQAGAEAHRQVQAAQRGGPARPEPLVLGEMQRLHGDEGAQPEPALRRAALAEQGAVGQPIAVPLEVRGARQATPDTGDLHAAGDIPGMTEAQTLGDEAGRPHGIAGKQAVEIDAGRQWPPLGGGRRRSHQLDEHPVRFLRVGHRRQQQGPESAQPAERAGETEQQQPGQSPDADQAMQVEQRQAQPAVPPPTPQVAPAAAAAARRPGTAATAIRRTG